jgi:hypothetical protein
MSIELSIPSVLNLSAILIIGVSVIYGSKAVKNLYSDEFATTIRWLLILVEAIFIVHLIIFFLYFFEIESDLIVIFVLAPLIFLSMLFFFASYKIIQFLELYSFEKKELSKSSVEKLIKKKQGISRKGI